MASPVWIQHAVKVSGSCHTCFSMHSPSRGLLAMLTVECFMHLHAHFVTAVYPAFRVCTRSHACEQSMGQRVCTFEKRSVAARCAHSRDNPSHGAILIANTVKRGCDALQLDSTRALALTAYTWYTQSFKMCPDMPLCGRLDSVPSIQFPVPSRSF
eukprot:365668-Chlamydomonas_euryale.AAC.4